MFFINYSFAQQSMLQGLMFEFFGTPNAKKIRVEMEATYRENFKRYGWPMSESQKFLESIRDGNIKEKAKDLDSENKNIEEIPTDDMDNPRADIAEQMPNISDFRDDVSGGDSGPSGNSKPDPFAGFKDVKPIGKEEIAWQCDKSGPQITCKKTPPDISAINADSLADGPGQPKNLFMKGPAPKLGPGGSGAIKPGGSTKAKGDTFFTNKARLQMDYKTGKLIHTPAPGAKKTKPNAWADSLTVIPNK